MLRVLNEERECNGGEEKIYEDFIYNWQWF